MLPWKCCCGCFSQSLYGIFILLDCKVASSNGYCCRNCYCVIIVFARQGGGSICSRPQWTFSRSRPLFHPRCLGLANGEAGRSQKGKRCIHLIGSVLFQVGQWGGRKNRRKCIQLMFPPLDFSPPHRQKYMPACQQCVFWLVMKWWIERSFIPLMILWKLDFECFSAKATGLDEIVVF